MGRLIDPLLGDYLDRYIVLGLKLRESAGGAHHAAERTEIKKRIDAILLERGEQADIEKIIDLTIVHQRMWDLVNFMSTTDDLLRPAGGNAALFTVSSGGTGFKPSHRSPSSGGFKAVASPVAPTQGHTDKARIEAQGRTDRMTTDQSRDSLATAAGHDFELTGIKAIYLYRLNERRWKLVDELSNVPAERGEKA